MFSFLYVTLLMLFGNNNRNDSVMAFESELTNFNANNIWAGMKINFDTESIHIDMPYIAVRVIQDKNTWRYSTSIIPSLIAIGTHFSGGGSDYTMEYNVITFLPLFINNGAICYKLNDHLCIGYRSEFDPFFLSNKIEPFWTSGIIQQYKYKKTTFKISEKWQWLNSYEEKSGFKIETGISWIMF